MKVVLSLTPNRPNPSVTLINQGIYFENAKNVVRKATMFG